jgi:hypothetical protein
MLIGIRNARLAVCGAAILALSLSLPLPTAASGAEFAGSYQIRSAVDDGAVVKFDLHATIFNYTGAAVSNATITVPSREPIMPLSEAADFSGAISGVSIPSRKSVAVDGTFTVPTREFHEIQRGIQPNVVLTYLDSEGKEIRGAAQLRAEIVTAKGGSR